MQTLLARLTHYTVLPLLALALLLPAAARAQTDDELQLFVRRNFGYSAGDQIQGSFRLEATAPPEVTSVTFYIDSSVAGIDAEAPFRVDFNTGDYDLGPHTFLAEATRANGALLTSQQRQFTFVSASAGLDTVRTMLTPLLAVVLGIVALVGGMAFLQARQSQRNPVPLGQPRTYGFSGGTICPKCHRPFSRHWWALNAGLGKLDRCDHCGRWSLVRALPLEQLRAAEAAELKSARDGTGSVPDLSPEERLRRQLDDSRYTDRLN
jgi:hypothetical protein